MPKNSFFLVLLEGYGYLGTLYNTVIRYIHIIAGVKRFMIKEVNITVIITF